MEPTALNAIFNAIGSIALVVLVILLSVILFYTISILRIIYEVMTLAKKKAIGLSIKTTDLKRYIGGTTALRFLMLFFRRRKGK